MERYIRTWLKALTDYWFTSMPAQRLAGLRICVGIFALWYFGRRIELYADVARSSPEYFDPVGLAALLSEPLSPVYIDYMFMLMLLLVVAFVAGWKHRILAPLLSLLSLFLISYRNSWSMIYHTDNAMWLQLFILSMVPAADCWSCDAWSQRRKQARDVEWKPVLISERYGWPIRLMAIATGLTYFLSGVAKVVGESGWSWALGEPLRLQLAVDGLRKELYGSHAPELAYFLFEHVWLFTLLGLGTLVLELGAPFFLIHRSVGRWWALATYGMHVGIWAAMGITFEYCLTGVVFLFAFDLEKLVGSILTSIRGIAGAASFGSRLRTIGDKA